MQGASTKLFHLNANPSGTSFVTINNPPGDALIFDLTDPDNPKRIGFSLASGSIEVVIPETQIERRLWVTSDPPATSELTLADFKNITASQFNYVIISHSSLMQAAGSSTDIVQEYANYRSSPEGGGFNPLVVDIDQLYDQFNYGEISPRAVYKFLEFMWNGGNMEYVFIIGKSLSVDHDYHRVVDGHK